MGEEWPRAKCWPSRGNILPAWKPDAYKDQYAANLSLIIAATIKGKGAKPRLGAIGAGQPKGEVADLMTRLRESLSANTNAREKPREANVVRERAD